MDIEKSPYKCTPFVYESHRENHTPCKCPVCSAWIKWDETGEIPICNNCGAELAKMPAKKPDWTCCKCGTVNRAETDCSKCGHKLCEECDEEENDYADGRICALSGPKWSKEERIKRRKERRDEKNAAKKLRLERIKENAKKQIERAQKRLDALK